MTPAQYNEYQRQADVIEQAKKWKEEQLKQMNSIEWFFNELQRMQYFIGNDMLGAYKEAQKMHKLEIQRAFIDGEENVWDRKNEGHEFRYDNHEHYYTEKFKKD